MIFRYVSLAGVGRREGNRGAEKLNRGVSVFRHLLGEPKRDDKNRNPVRGKDLTRGGLSVASAAASVFFFSFSLLNALVFSRLLRLRTWSCHVSRGSDSRPQELVVLGLRP